MTGCGCADRSATRATACSNPTASCGFQKARQANAELLELADAFEAKGLTTEIVAAGGLGTWDITGANERITEIHAGSYIFMDAFHYRLVPGFEPGADRARLR